MAVRGFFYNSVNKDRLYNGQDMNEDKAPFYKEGVAYGHLQVTADGESMAVKVDGGSRTGYAYINLHTIHNTTVLELPVSGSNGTLPRIDRVILRNDETERKPSIFILEGAYSSNPQPPELTNNDTIQEKCLAEIYVAAGAVAISQSDITDTRADTGLCGFIASQFEDFDFSQFTKQFNAWFALEKKSMEQDHANFIEEYAEMTQAFMTDQEAQWNKWFKEKQTELSGDIAGKLQLQIDDVKEKVYNIAFKVYIISTLEQITSPVTVKLTNKTTGTMQAVTVTKSQMGFYVTEAGEYTVEADLESVMVTPKAFKVRLLVDDVTKTDARALLNVNKMATISDIVAPSNEYIYASGANELTVVEGCVIAVGGAGIFKTANTILTAANLDAGSAFAVGKDYYVYICDSRIDSADEKYVISLNSTYPTGWNATNSRKIGGFHYGRCRKVDSNLQPLNGSSVIFGTGWESAVSNGIVPRSVWTLGHRPKCSPEGMVYLGGGTWVDIYLNSDDGAKGLKSEYGCAPMTGTESMNWYNFVERLAKSGKRLPNYAEFCAYAFGSPAGLDNANTNAWSATSNTGRGVTGSVVNAVSSVGVVDAVGRVWEWLDELITRAEHATNADYHASVAWGWDKKSPLNTGEKSYDVGNIYQYYAYSLAALVAGGYWSLGANCGARAVSCNGYPWTVATIVGARGACDSL